jgi:CheY-like chemotaxis protein
MASVSILVVDDDAAIRAAMCRTLRLEGYLVDEAADGARALPLLETGTTDLLITDILMPNLDGLELISLVKQAHPELRILAMSGGGPFGHLDILNVASKLGADSTLTKPFSSEQLLAKVSVLVEAAPVAGPR